MGTTLRSATPPVPPDSGSPPVPTHPPHTNRPPDHLTDTSPQRGPQRLPTPSRDTGRCAETLGACARTAQGRGQALSSPPDRPTRWPSHPLCCPRGRVPVGAPEEAPGERSDTRPPTPPASGLPRAPHPLVCGPPDGGPPRSRAGPWLPGGVPPAARMAGQVVGACPRRMAWVACPG
jgi:hypothetical protein